MITSRKQIQKKYYEQKHLAVYYEKKFSKINEHYQHLKKFKTLFEPGHFYSPYVNKSELNKRSREIFDRSKKALPGIDLAEKQQLTLLKKLAKHYKKIPKIQKNANLRYKFGKNPFSYTDATVLFCMINELRPKRIIEIGSGYSSAMMLDVNERFFDNKIDLTFIEPYPETLKKLVKETDKNNYTLIEKRLFEVNTKIFSKLKAGDILFIDSTHVSKPGSDVNQLFFEIIPLLNRGVIIHIHDIFYPFEYPEEWIRDGRAWNENYIVRAFLQDNPNYKILFFNHFINLHHSKELNKLLPRTAKNTGGSLWLEKTK